MPDPAVSVPMLPLVEKRFVVVALPATSEVTKAFVVVALVVVEFVAVRAPVVMSSAMREVSRAISAVILLE